MKRGIAHLLACLSAALLLLAGLATSSAQAQGMGSLKDKMFGKRVEDGRAHAPPKVAHYISEDGQSFIFDESQPQPLMRFDGDDEVWVLTASPGTKGDVIYKNDTGEQMLKATRWGGMVLFSDDRPMGDPVAVTGKASAFVPDIATPALLWQAAARASRRITQAGGDHLIPFATLTDATPDTAALYADAIDVTSAAIVRASLQPHGKQALENLREVHFVDGRPPSAYLDQQGVLTLKLDASRGPWAGHVSSKRVTNVLMASFSIARGR